MASVLTQDLNDRPNAALYRLLAEAVHGGQAKVDALLALMQRTVFVVPWPAGADGYRTLVNSQGVAALPIFTERDELETAARRYGWVGADGTSPASEIGARRALHYALTQSLAFVVVDIAADHCVEVGREEFEPLLSPAARRESSGPFAGAGRISSNLMRAVRPGRPTPAPGSLESPINAPSPPPGSLADVTRPPGSSPGTVVRPATSPGTEPAARRDLTPAAGLLPAVGPAPSVAGIVLPSDALGEPAEPPSDELLQALEPILRDYPEIEWACIGSSEGRAVIGLRIDPRVRQRVEEIAGRLASATAPSSLPTMLIDDAPHLRAARADAVVFYPWKRR